MYTRTVEVNFDTTNNMFRLKFKHVLSYVAVKKKNDRDSTTREYYYIDRVKCFCICEQQQDSS